MLPTGAFLLVAKLEMLPTGAFLLVAKLFYSYTIRDTALKGATSYYGIFKIYSIQLTRKNHSL